MCVCYYDYPRFTGIKDIKEGYSYDYNPCTPFSEGTQNACQNVFVSVCHDVENSIHFLTFLQVCQTLAAKQLIYTVADGNEQIYFEPSSGKYYVQYTGPPDQKRYVCGIQWNPT